MSRLRLRSTRRTFQRVENFPFVWRADSNRSVSLPLVADDFLEDVLSAMIFDLRCSFESGGVRLEAVTLECVHGAQVDLSVRLSW